jgi:hypothetical protein
MSVAVGYYSNGHFRHDVLLAFPVLHFLCAKRRNFGVDLFVSHPMMTSQQPASCIRPLS